MSAFEVRRWQQELSHENEQIRQLAIDEIALMLKRLSLAGWQPILVNKTSRTHKNSVSRHAQFYVSQMLEFIAAHYDQALTVNAVAEHVKLNPNYAMGVFQRVMQQTMKQYITAMRINHVRALLSDTDKTILGYCPYRRFSLQQPLLQHLYPATWGMPPQQYRKLSQQRRHGLAFAGGINAAGVSQGGRINSENG
ncbi:transcriptional regulator MelR [Klebsiella pneumoniae subsp. pneumoniae]|nr:transcriptional regulator MelR [Klebsiella pneumoniae subsp. pneumoniae]